MTQDGRRLCVAPVGSVLNLPIADLYRPQRKPDTDKREKSPDWSRVVLMFAFVAHNPGSILERDYNTQRPYPALGYKTPESIYYVQK